VDPLQQPGLVQLAQVAPDRVLRDAQGRAQFRGENLPLTAQGGQDVLLAFFF
jgi:hypothetical protein